MLLLGAALLASVVFFARKHIVAYSINDYLLAHKAQLSCIEFNFTPSLNLIISKVCIHSPKADIELENVSLQLKFSSTIPVSAIKIEAMSIKAKAKLLEQGAANQQAFDESSVKHFLAIIAQFTVPLPITIEKFTYLPFTQVDNTEKPVFYGQFIANKNNIKLTLKDLKQANILSVNLSSEGQGFTAQLNSDLAQVTQFLAVHQLELPATLDKNLMISGKFTTQLQWHKETLTATSQLNNVAIDSIIRIEKSDIAKSGKEKAGIAKSDLFNINGMLSWQTRITAAQALFTIDEQSVVNTSFSEQKLREFLVRNNIAADVITVIKDNPSNGFVIKPWGRVQIDLAKQQVFIANVELTANNKENLLQATFTDTSLVYEKNKTLNLTLKQSNYAVQAKLLISRLNNISKQAVNIASTGKTVSKGKMTQHNLGWQIMLAPTTTLELSTLALAKLAASPAQQNSSNQNALSIKKIMVNGQGTIDIDNQGRTELSLQLNSQLSQLKIANIAQIAQVALQADISGKLQDISITANISVDKQPLANVKLNGVITEPRLDIFAKNLDLTELLTLNLNLPIELSLIDGSISYQLSGQLTDIDNWLNNAARLEVSIHDVTGDVEDTWLQELNWQQEFILSDGDINTVGVDKKPTNNLTIAKVETTPPLTELSAQTTFSFKNKALSISAAQINAKALGGSVNIAQAHWPFDISRSVNVQLTSIDLEELLELDPKQGIIVTGKISGNLPIMFNDQQFTIAGGKLHNVNNGIIKVANNPTVEELKASDIQLKLAFDAMQNIHYHQLSSDVSMANDGYMLFDTVIKGRNPDLDNDVNLNLNLSYDLLGLLKSINISEHLEQSLIDGLQKN